MVERVSDRRRPRGMRRLLQEASQLSNALDIIVATQGSDSPAVSPLLSQLTSLHRVIEDVYEETRPPSVPNEDYNPKPSPEPAGDDFKQLENRLDKTEEQFNNLKDSISRLVGVLGKKNDIKAKAEQKAPPLSGETVPLTELRTRNVKLQREVERHRDVEVSLLTTMRDVRAASQAKSEFLANMSHELRTPLNAIIGFAEIMESELVGPLGSSQYIGYAKDVRESGQYLLELINDILDLSKIEAGQLEASLEDVDLRKTVDVCLRMVNDQATEAGLKIALNADDDIPAIRSNARMLRQIILNLLSNAIKFTPREGRVGVEIKLDVESRVVSLIFEDTGIGIARSDIARVMQPFEQVESAQGSLNRGTGLGLPMAKSLVELLGGEFKIRSEIDAGTTVTIDLPTKSSD